MKFGIVFKKDKSAPGNLSKRQKVLQKPEADC
jgi:hypothetical protein